MYKIVDKTGNGLFRGIRIVCARNLIFPFIVAITALFIYYVLPFRQVFNPVRANGSAAAVKLYDQGYKYAKVKLEKLYYTGFDLMDDGETVASYYYELADGKCTFYILDNELVVNKPQVINNVEFNVKLSDINGLTENMMNSFAGSIGWNAGSMLEITSKAVMDETEYHRGMYTIAFFIVMAAVIVSVVFITIYILCILFPFIHISLIRLYAEHPFGLRTALADLTHELDNIKAESGNMFITENYFFNLGPKDVSMIPLNRIIMAYEHGRLISIFGFHFRLTHTMHMRGKYGERIVASGKNIGDLEIIIGYLKENYPDILWGHTKENRLAAKEIIKENKKKRKKL